MGKISDALEKYHKEGKLNAEPIPIDKHIPKPSSTIPPTSQYVTKKGKYDPKVVVLSQPGSFDAENFKILRSQILFPKDGKRPRVIMVTSAMPGEGKTFVSVNLAASIALGIDEYVLLVDCDFRRSRVANMLGITYIGGLHEYLLGKLPLPEVIVKTGFGKLSVIPAGAYTDNPSELLASKMMRRFLEEVRDRYDDRYIIVDATPAQVTAEASVLSRYVDAVLFVIMAGRAPRDAVERSIDNLSREKIIGIVFNGYTRTQKGYKKYYKNYYT